MTFDTSKCHLKELQACQLCLSQLDAHTGHFDVASYCAGDEDTKSDSIENKLFVSVAFIMK
jgi:hypothetical protein